MDGTDRRERLGQFLRSCRDRMQPEAAGFDGDQRRRTPGLRREEVAALAGISTTYYTKIEQGRVDVSQQVLNKLADVLELNHVERDYAFSLAYDYVLYEPGEQVGDVSPALDLLLDSLEPYPAQVLNHRWDFVRWNQATIATFHDLSALPAEARNHVVTVFTAPEMRQVIGDWEYHARRIVAEFRADYGKYHRDKAFTELVNWLRQNSPEFGLWWNETYHIGAQSETSKVINHPAAGVLKLQQMALSVHDRPDLRVLVFLPLDSESKEKLEHLYHSRLAALSASPEA